MDEKLWKLRCRTPGVGLGAVEEQTFYTEGGFILGLQTAYGNSADDLAATLPDGCVLNEPAIRKRYPPE